MAFRKMHLDKSGSGMSFKTACGRNTMRTPTSADWDYFKALPHDQQCAKCAASKQAELNARMDAKKEAQLIEAWQPEDQDAWMANDDAIVAANKGKQGK